MPVLPLLLVLSLSFVPVSTAMAAGAEPFAELRSAQRMGWDTASILAQGMAGSDPRRFPGIHAWLKEYRAIGGVPGKRAATAVIPKFDVDRLVTRSPAFWRAYFEMAPADSGAMLLHAGLLLAAGEASRAAYVLLIARQNRDIGKEMLEGINAMLEHAQGVLQRGAQEVSEAVKLHDAGSPQAAATRLRTLLAEWPGNALAHYELALTMVAQQYADSGRKPPLRARLSIHSELSPSTAALSAYTRARSHDPLLIRAYQGNEGSGANVLMVLGKTVRPLWESIARDTQAETSDDTLNTLAGALHEAGIAELAVATIQVLVAREGGYDDDDRKFIAAVLRGLAPSAIDVVIKRLAQARPEFAKIVLP